ncbi:hypothetical protein B0H67DRAFT_350330 [Lasiosphaeris hirsuta]|uniref:Uncharacterized protein n=1 Tax=Lasiosphaeris hirsuta TaxID=260670 RepID=A0AA39ZVJ3_9PEZI|nr:hypothetical protein B0H67DRAFT_350330 [Lasiosphaeris hirsuta]
MVESQCGGQLLKTEKELMGMASPRAQKGDFICVLLGHDVPVIMRRQGGRWLEVGPIVLCPGLNEWRGNDGPRCR